MWQYNSDDNKAHIRNIHALNSDTHTLRIQYEYTRKQCVGVAIEGMDIGGTRTLFQDFVKFLNFQKLFISSC